VRGSVSERVRLVEKDARLPTRADGTLRLVVVADTHSNPHPKAAERIRALEPDAILHGGDIGDLRVIDDLEKIAPVLAVRGNIDSRIRTLPDVLDVAVTSNEEVVLTILLTHIAVYGPKIRGEIAKLAKSRGASLVVCGHSHVPFIGKDKGLVVFNPGSIGPRRFHLPIVFGTIELSAEGLRIRHVDCETGERWEPPGIP
jgi:uncharacterized protein